MFIEMAEHLVCPVPHSAQAHCVVVPDEVVERMVRQGVVACPACRSEYPIVDGVVRFGPPPATIGGTDPDPTIVQALLDLSGAGGYVVLVGGAAGLARPLSTLQPGVHMVTVNAAAALRDHGASHLEATDRIPLRSEMARGVVVGAGRALNTWTTEGARVLLRGRRLVVLAEVELPPGIEQLAVGDGLTVGERRPG